MGKYRMKEKRILLFMREYILGGAETQFRYLIEYAERHEWKLDVIIEHDLKIQNAFVQDVSAQMKHVNFYELEGTRAGKKMLLNVLLHIIKTMPYVKYHSCLIYYPKDLDFVPLLRIFGMRVIYSERVDAAEIVANEYYQRCLKLCSCIIANSKYAKNQLEKLTGRKVILIRNGKPIVSDVAIKKEHQISRILVPARIAPPKNQILPLYYLKECTDFDGKIVFAGFIEDKSYYNKLKQFVRKNALQDKVEFLGYKKDINIEYEKADLILLPSFAEGTPNVVLEAYACGRPVIVTDIDVEKDVVPNPRLRFGIKDPMGIDECIRYIQEMSDKTYRQLIESNRRFVLKNYNIETMAKSYYQILSK